MPLGADPLMVTVRFCTSIAVTVRDAAKSASLSEASIRSTVIPRSMLGSASTVIVVWLSAAGMIASLPSPSEIRSALMSFRIRRRKPPSIIFRAVWNANFEFLAS